MTALQIIISVIMLTLIGSYIFLRLRMRNIPHVDDHEKILSLTDKNFKNQTRNKIILVDFWAGWCVPCRMMAPVLNEVAGELSGNSYVGKVDIEKYQNLAQQYNVRSIPTLVLLSNGKEVNRFVGVKSKDFLLRQIRNLN